jgi:hypothetical protein
LPRAFPGRSRDRRPAGQPKLAYDFLAVDESRNP